MPVYTSRQAKISLSIPGVSLDSKSWDKFSGGGHEAETGQYNPGGMAPAVAHAGVSKRNQITLERGDDDTLIGLRAALDAAVNQPCSVGVTPLKSQSVAAGKQTTYTGIVRSVSPPDNDSTSSSVRMIQVVIEADEPIA